MLPYRSKIVSEYIPVWGQKVFSLQAVSPPVRLSCQTPGTLLSYIICAGVLSEPWVNRRLKG